MVANLVEGRTANVDVVRIDDQGQPLPAGQGKVPADIILRELEFKVRNVGCGAGVRVVGCTHHWLPMLL